MSLFTQEAMGEEQKIYVAIETINKLKKSLEELPKAYDNWNREQALIEIEEKAQKAGQ
jgi:phage shock protein A